MNRCAILLAVALLGIGLRSSAQTGTGTATEPRLRLVPQTTDSLLADIEESADGSRLITHDRRFAPRLWDAKTLRLLRVLGGTKERVPIVRFSPDGHLVLTMSLNELRIWDSSRANQLANVKIASPRTFTEAEFSPDGTLVALGTSGGEVWLAKTDTGKVTQTLKGPAASVSWIDWSGDGKKVAACSAKSVQVWTTADGELQSLNNPGFTEVRYVDLNQAGTLAVATDASNGSFTFDLGTGKTLYTVSHVIGDRTEELRSFVGAQFVGDQDADLLYFNKDGDGVITDAKTGTEKRRLKGHTAPVDEIRINRQKNRAATHGDDGAIFLWDLNTGGQTPFTMKEDDLPTAGAFGTTSGSWWLGLINGEIRKYDLKTGLSTSGTLGSVNTLARIRFLKSGRLLAVSNHSTGSLFLDNISESKILAFSNKAPDENLYRLSEEVFSDSGRYNVADAQGNIFFPPVQFRAFDLFSGDGLWGINAKDGLTAEFVPGMDYAMMTAASGSVFTWDFTVGKPVVQIKFSNPAPNFTGTISDDGTLAFHGPYGENWYAIWQLSDQKVITSVEIPAPSKYTAFDFAHDGKTIAGISPNEFSIWNVETGEKVVGTPLPSGTPFFQLIYTRSGNRVIAFSDHDFAEFDATTGKLICAQHSDLFAPLRDQDQRANATGTKWLKWDASEVTIWDTDADKADGTIQLNDEAIGAIYSPDDKRILTIDRTDGIVIWDATTLKRLGNLVQMRDGSWLVMDTEGRYDATDPSDVTGALYVMEWEGGLEPLDVAQFKGYFWDPGLLQKLLGTSKEKKRDVPSLASLHLYPKASLKFDEKGAVTIGLEDRDEGGIGRVVVSVNGKEIMTKSGIGYFKVGAEELKPYLLPENLLKDGHGNIVSVRASNSEGTLTSLPTTLDIGVPTGLKSPDVKLYALFVGAGDYVGQSRDLKAPPSDADDLAKAIQKVSGGFLSNRVSITELTTANNSDQRPTRENILQWFDETSKKATSSDIVMVFFAGHGMDKLGSKVGYFFLTSEADPDSLTEANLGSVSVSGEDLRTKLKAIAANKQIVILDTCHSGAAAGNIVDGGERSVSGDYQRAWEAIKDATGTWMLAGAAADQLSYESSNVDHGMLTYALLEAIDKANSDGLRPGQGGEMFVDVERWLNYAANRVESLKNEVGLKGIQRPEFKRSAGGGSFDIGVLNEKDRGALGLKPPLPVVIVGPFELEQEDPENLEDPIRDALGDSGKIKAWLDVSKHPNVYRIAGEYTVTGNKITVKVFIQRFDGNQKRTTLKTLEVNGEKGKAAALATAIRAAVESEILALEAAKAAPKP